MPAFHGPPRSPTLLPSIRPALTALTVLAAMGTGAPALEAQETEPAVALVSDGLSQREGRARDALVQAVVLPGEEGDRVRAVLVEAARGTDDAVVFAAAVGLLVRFANAQPRQVGEVVPVLSGFATDASYTKKAVAVDALENLPPGGRTAMIPVLVEQIRGGGDTPETRLYLRGLWELGAEGVERIRALVADGALSGESLRWARIYLREGA